MAKVLTDESGTTHLRGQPVGTLCGAHLPDKSTCTDEVMSCALCAEIALQAIELTTKAERREWRVL